MNEMDTNFIKQYGKIVTDYDKTRNLSNNFGTATVGGLIATAVLTAGAFLFKKPSANGINVTAPFVSGTLTVLSYVICSSSCILAMQLRDEARELLYEYKEAQREQGMQPFTENPSDYASDELESEQSESSAE